jgi:uncharacterized protein (TIGR03790 family)
MMKVLLYAPLLWMATWAALAVDSGHSVVVVYNRNMPESKKLAEYYAEKRGVPRNQLFGADVSNNPDTISRSEFRDKLQTPLFDWLVAEKLFVPSTQTKPAGTSPAAKNPGVRTLADATVRYIVLCYGIPLAIARDTTLKEEVEEKMQETLRGRNDAAVDADLAMLPVSREKTPLTGPLANPFYLGTNRMDLHPTNGVIMVTRLDGPSVEIARGLVDKALEAETNGLWGRAYFDARGITNGEYQLGDDWMRLSAEVTRRMGFETVLDNKEPTFSAGFPMSQIAFYAGWYELNASGPFIQPAVEFMPGAFAYHLHSYSGAGIRSKIDRWVGPLLAKGATITMGSVAEPYLPGTPNVAAFIDRLVFRKYTFGEAAYTCQASLSWQTTVVGDPLYCPFGQPPDQIHYKLEREKNPLVEWSHLRVVGLNQATGLGVDELIKYLSDVPTTTNSAVLTEKLGDLKRVKGRISAACEEYAAAVKLKPSPQQKIRLLLTIGELQSLIAREQEAFDAYKQLITEVPNYIDAGTVYKQLASLAVKLGKKEDAEKFAQEAEQRGKGK